MEILKKVDLSEGAKQKSRMERIVPPGTGFPDHP